MKEKLRTSFVPPIKGGIIFYSCGLRRSMIYVKESSIFLGFLQKEGIKVCISFSTHPQPLFLEGSLKVAAKGSLISKRYLLLFIKSFGRIKFSIQDVHGVLLHFKNKGIHLLSK